ncbi:hypothetical protein PQR26_05675 [Paraburkholderia sediminicola]
MACHPKREITCEATTPPNADPHSRPIDRADNRLLARADCQGQAAAGIAHAIDHHRIFEAFRHAHHRRKKGLVESEHVAGHREVHARAERAARAGNHDGADRIVVAGALKDVDQFNRSREFRERCPQRR